MDDVELMLRVKDGDVASFELLMDRYRQPLFRYFYRMTGDSGCSEDLFQETFLRLYRHAQRYEPRSRFSTYLYTIATRLGINYLKSSRRREVPLEFEGESGIQMRSEVLNRISVDNEHAPDRDLERSERQQMVRRAFDHLSPMHRSVLLMSEFEGKSYEEISEVLGCSLGTVKSRINRAKKSLKEWLVRHEVL